MQLIETKENFRTACEQARGRGARVGLVPTMGALHAGHLALVAEARRRGATFVVLTIFVNPTQFGPNEDFSRYPRTLEADLAQCRAHGVDAVFCPAADAMYPSGFETFVEVTALTKRLEGEFRPTHFRGVATIVAKLFALTGPCVAVFGRKDYQQWRVLARMAIDLDLPVEVVGLPTVREADGLALSSRNRYLSPSDRVRALGIVTGLRAANAAWAGGERSVAALRAAAMTAIAASADRLDYVDVCDADSLAPFATDTVDGKALVVVAIHVGSARLIDNCVLGEDALS